jgi:glycosyltransferase EpsF
VRKRRVLHIIDGFGAGGAETWLLATVKYLKTHPHLNLQFDFLATGGEVRLFDEEIKEQGCKIFYVKYSFKSLFSFRAKLKSILLSNQYDAIHDHQDFISGWHFLLGAGYMPNVRIAHLHNPFNFVDNYVVNPVRWFSYHLGRLLTVALTSKITGTSNAVMDEYGYNKWPFSKRRTSPAYCGFDVNKFAYNSQGKEKLCKELGWEIKECKIALFVGRIGLQDNDTAANQKNPEFAFSVAKELVSLNDNWKFVFVGYKGNVGSNMETEVRKAGLADKIKFLGLRNDVPDIMSAADVLIFPSLWEGLGMVAVEAQCCGLPIILSDTIPVEAILCDELVVVKKLEDGIKEWIDSIVRISNVRYNRSDYAFKINASPFSIYNSINNLIQIYTPCACR